MLRLCLSGILVVPCVLSFANGEEPAKRSTVDLLGDPLPFGARARLGTVRLRHGGRVAGVAISSNGKLIASASADRTVRLWEGATGKEIAQFRGHRGEVRCV